MKTKDYPDYVDYGGDIVFPSPFTLEMSEAYFFSVPCKRTVLKELLDTWFEKPTGGKFKAELVSPFVNIIYCRYSDGFSTDPEYITKGGLCYDEIIFGTMVRLIPEDSKGLFPGKIYSFVPFIYVDNPAAMAGGREVIGMPKMLAKFELQKDKNSGEDHPLHGFSMQVYDLAMNETEARWMKVLEIMHSDKKGERHKSGSEVHTHPEDVSPFRKWMRAAKDLAADTTSMALTQVGKMLPDWFQSKFVTLKQFRDSENPMQALYQSIVEYSATDFNITEVGILDSVYEVRFPEPSMTCDFAKNLGIKNGQKVPFGFFIKGSFSFSPGKEIWTSTPF